MAGDLMKYKRILVIDDSATSRMIIKRCFEIAGLRDSEYIEVEDGLKAIRYFEEGSVDLIVTDLKMPKMDGGTLIQKLRSTKDVASVPILVISSMGGDAVDKELLEIGAQAVIRKPVSPEKIMSALEVLE